MSRTSSRSVHCLYAGIVMLAVLADPAAAESPPDAPALINAMSRAMRELDYDGVFIYRRNRQIESMRLLHRSDAGGERERLVALTGMPREVIRNDKSVTCIFPERQSVMVERSGPRKLVTQLPEPIERIARHYTFNIEGEDRVAGRDAWVVSVRPRDAYRYGYHFWIDRESNLLLKSELRNQSGLSLEEIMFTQLQVMNPLPEELLSPSISGQDYTWYHAAAAERPPGASRDMWRVTWVPGGFAQSSHEQQAMVASGDPVDHLVYTDGLASVSVFVERLQQGPVHVGPSQVGGVNTFARFADGFQVTAVGEVPQVTVQRMANSVVPGP